MSNKNRQAFFPTDPAHKQTQIDALRKPAPTPLKAQTPKQKAYLKKLKHGSHDILIATGPAGSGKTYMAMRTAIEQFQRGDFNKIIITRPTVSSGDEDYGYLPGSLLEKLSPWCIPLLDIAKECFTPQQVEQMLMREEIELAPLGFMRGRTLKNAIVIVDEAQNCDISQMKMVMTRLGDNSRMIITGDMEQTDLRAFTDANGNHTTRTSGLGYFINRLEAREEMSRHQLPLFLTEGVAPPEQESYKHERIGYVRLTREDVVRHPVIDEVLDLFAE